MHRATRRSIVVSDRRRSSRAHSFSILDFACHHGLSPSATGLADTARTLAPGRAAAVPLYAPVVALLPSVTTDSRLGRWCFSSCRRSQPNGCSALLRLQRHLTEGLSSCERATREEPTCRSPQLSLQRLTRGIAIRLVTQPLLLIYSRDIAARMGLRRADQQNGAPGGLVHDIGKIGLPAGLLEKEGPLTLEERRVMQGHSEIGERILANVDDYGDIAHVVSHHHERVDGNGYPDGLDDEEIPFLSRIIAVADAYNAMTSHRPYREAMPSRVASMRLAQAVGSQFDTTVVAAFEAILATADDSYRLGKTPDFDFSLEGREEPRDLRSSRTSLDHRPSCVARMCGSRSRLDAELLEDVPHVNLHGHWTDEERSPISGVRHSLGEQREHLLLPG